MTPTVPHASSAVTPRQQCSPSCHGNAERLLEMRISCCMPGERRDCTDAELVAALRVLPARFHKQFLAEYDAAIAGARRPEEYRQLQHLLRLSAVAFSDPGYEARRQAVEESVRTRRADSAGPATPPPLAHTRINRPQPRPARRQVPFGLGPAPFHGSKSTSSASCTGRSASGTLRKFSRILVQVDDLPRIESTRTSAGSRQDQASG